MLCNPISSFPENVDAQTYFQDITIDGVPIMEHYNELIAQGKFNEANEYIQDQQIHGYFADFFNMLENRIDAIQTYLRTKTKVNPIVRTESSDVEPEASAINTIWF